MDGKPYPHVCTARRAGCYGIGPFGETASHGYFWPAAKSICDRMGRSFPPLRCVAGRSKTHPHDPESSPSSPFSVTSRTPPAEMLTLRRVVPYTGRFPKNWCHRAHKAAISWPFPSENTRIPAPASGGRTTRSRQSSCNRAPNVASRCRRMWSARIVATTAAVRWSTRSRRRSAHRDGESEGEQRWSLLPESVPLIAKPQAAASRWSVSCGEREPVLARQRTQ
jgi:hypothetical protein